MNHFVIRKFDNGGAHLGFSRYLPVASSERRVETMKLCVGDVWKS